MQRILYRTPSARALYELFEQAGETDELDDAECELPLAAGHEPVAEGAWVLAVFETAMLSDAPPPSCGPTSRPPASSRATCAPARVVLREDGTQALRFAAADWQRIASYARLRSEAAPPSLGSDRVRTSRPVHVPSVFPAAPLPQVEALCVVHWYQEEALGERLAEALGATCHGVRSEAELRAYSSEQALAGQRIDGFVLAVPADEELAMLIRHVRSEHERAVVLCMVSGARAQVMRSLFEAGADEVLQAQTPPAEAAVTLLALMRRRASKDGDALGAA